MPESGEQMPEIPGGTNNGDAPPDSPQDNGNLGGRPNDKEMQKSENRGNTGDTSKDNNFMKKTNTLNTFSIENIILFCVSAAVLIMGCIIAYIFKRR